jgi:predicted O-linked N-acetylglucosamine transferase (SPINDLY family)
MSDNVGQRAFQNARLKKKQDAETAKLLERAVALVNTGALPDARAVLQQLLQLAPRHFEALHLLGMTEYHTRRSHEAERFLAQAVDIEPRSVDAHFNRGVVLTSLGRFDDARASYQRATALKPQHANALYNLAHVNGILNLPDEAIENYDRAIAVKKDFAEARYGRGLVLEKLGRYQEALESHERALVIKPRYVDALNGRGSALHELGRFTEALRSYDEALAINSRFAPGHNKRGITLFALDRNDDALDSYDGAIAADPGFADAHNNKAVVLHELGRYADALESCNIALAIDPASWTAFNCRGAILSSLRDYNGAMASFARAIEIRPDYAEAFANRGSALLDMDQPAEALRDLDRAVALNPRLFKAWMVRGSTLLASKRTSEAIACCETALAIKPDAPDAFAVLGVCLAALGDIEGALAKFDRALAIKPDCVDAIVTKIFVLDFSSEADFEQHRDVRRLWWKHMGSKIRTLGEPYRNIRDPQRRLVLGYMSSDFRNHSAARAFKPVLKFTDNAQFETVCYSCSPTKDAITDEFRQIADRWHDASQWSDDRLSDQIRQDGIDILIDLSGFTAGARLNVIACKPAPIVVHGWGHGTPPGMPTIDYVFSDPVSIPPAARHLFTEKLYDLPCATTLDPLPADVPVAPNLPAITNGFMTFGAFNRVSKISDAAAEVWARILDRLPDAKLLIKDAKLDDPMIRDNLLARFTRHGVTAGRIALLGATSRAVHLAAMSNVDISLDTFPQNGGVSTWESLQLGVPVVTKLGVNLSSRAAGGILCAVGLSDWVGNSAEDYIGIAVARATRIDELANLRRALPGQIAASKAGNPKAYAAEVGKAYRSMWQTYCARETDQHDDQQG